MLVFSVYYKQAIDLANAFHAHCVFCGTVPVCCIATSSSHIFPISPFYFHFPFVSFSFPLPFPFPFFQVSGTTKADDAFWEQQCRRVPAAAQYAIVRMGEVVDYFKPMPGKTWCEMLTNNTNHMWSPTAEDGTWRPPPQSELSNHLGGSFHYWPQKNVEGDNRRFLSIWGTSSLGSSTLGGCCAGKTTRDYGGWGQSFSMHFAYPMVEFPLVAVSTCVRMHTHLRIATVQPRATVLCVATLSASFFLLSFF